MEKELGALIDARTPPVNRDLGRGYATKEIPMAPEYVANVLRALKLNERVDPAFKFIGIRPERLNSWLNTTLNLPGRMTSLDLTSTPSNSCLSYVV